MMPTTPLRVGVAIEETWSFFREIYDYWQSQFQVTLFERPTATLPVFTDRMNRYLFSRNLQNLLQNNDVVFFEWSSELLAAATHLPKTCGIVTRLHRYEMYRWVDQVNWQAVDRLIVVTEAKKQEFLAKFPFMADRVNVIPEAVSLARFSPFDKPFRGDIGTLCSLIPRKRVYELILAFYELAVLHPELHLHIAGPEREVFAEYAQALYRLVERLGLQERVTFYGRIEDPENWYRKLDLFISNSYSEGLQVALLEAMACGIISLSHAWEGAEELLPADHLFLSEAQLIARLDNFLGLPADRRSEVRAQMIALVAGQSNLEATIQDITRVIEQVADASRPKENTSG
jgi:glycosyltransferase involved in cell wall biosynthesis